MKMLFLYGTLFLESDKNSTFAGKGSQLDLIVN